MDVQYMCKHMYFHEQNMPEPSDLIPRRNSLGFSQKMQECGTTHCRRRFVCVCVCVCVTHSPKSKCHSISKDTVLREATEATPSLSKSQLNIPPTFDKEVIMSRGGRNAQEVVDYWEAWQMALTPRNEPDIPYVIHLIRCCRVSAKWEGLPPNKPPPPRLDHDGAYDFESDDSEDEDSENADVGNPGSNYFGALATQDDSIEDTEVVSSRRRRLLGRPAPAEEPQPGGPSSRGGRGQQNPHHGPGRGRGRGDGRSDSRGRGDGRSDGRGGGRGNGRGTGRGAGPAREHPSPFFGIRPARYPRSQAYDHQWRYMRIQCICFLAELLMLGAIHAENWLDKATLWSEAYDEANKGIIEMDPWRAIYMHAEEQGFEARLLEHHNRGALEQLFVNMDTVRDHMSKEKEKAIGMMHKRINYLLGRLRPEWSDRDAAKSRMGEDKWKNNPSPTFEFAKRRELNEKELKELREAVECLESLRLQAWSVAAL
jgi:hypothetical protein